MRNGTTIPPRNDSSSNRIDVSSNDPEQAIEAVLGDQPRADYWRELREILSTRLQQARAERDTFPLNHPERTPLEKRVMELRQQVRALETEEAVTQFVEDSIRSTLSRPSHPGTLAVGAYDEFDEFEE